MKFSAMTIQQCNTLRARTTPTSAIRCSRRRAGPRPKKEVHKPDPAKIFETPKPTPKPAAKKPRTRKSRTRKPRKLP